MSKESEYRWFDAENPYIMQTPYGEVSLEQWRKANEEWKEKQLPEPEERVDDCNKILRQVNDVLNKIK